MPFSLYSVFYAINKKGKNAKRDNEKFRRFIRKCHIVNVKKALSNSRPCKRCLSLLKKFGIQKIYYSNLGNITTEKVKDMTSDHISSKYKKPWSEFNSNK